MCLPVRVKIRRTLMQMHKCIPTEMHAHGCTSGNGVVTHAQANTPTHTHTHSKHTPSQICIFLIPSTLLRLHLLSSLCLSGVIVSILLHQGAPEGYKLNINANALSHCPPPPPPPVCTRTHTQPSSPFKQISVSAN